MTCVVRGDLGGGERCDGTRGDGASRAHDSNGGARLPARHSGTKPAIAEKLGVFMRSVGAASEEPGGSVLSITSRTVSP